MYDVVKYHPSFIATNSLVYQKKYSLMIQNPAYWYEPLVRSRNIWVNRPVHTPVHTPQNKTPYREKPNGEAKL